MCRCRRIVVILHDLPIFISTFRCGEVPVVKVEQWAVEVESDGVDSEVADPLVSVDRRGEGRGVVEDIVPEEVFHGIIQGFWPKV